MTAALECYLCSILEIADMIRSDFAGGRLLIP